MTGTKIRGAFKRAAAGCEAVCNSEDNSSPSRQPKGFSLVDLDGSSRYRARRVDKHDKEGAFAPNRVVPRSFLRLFCVSFLREEAFFVI
jgi:hypothetical protein